jgi:subtilisin family serine protease
LSIGALASNLSRASYSNRDTLDLDFAFPGSGISGAIGASSYGSKSGTSMASPHCAGYFALLKQALPNVSVDSLVAIAKAASKDLGAVGHDPLTGWGLPRADRGVALALGLEGPTSTAGTLTFAGLGTQCAPVESPVEWTLSGASGLTVTKSAAEVCITNTDPAPRTVHLTLTGVP